MIAPGPAHENPVTACVETLFGGKSKKLRVFPLYVYDRSTAELGMGLTEIGVVVLSLSNDDAGGGLAVTSHWRVARQRLLMCCVCRIDMHAWYKKTGRIKLSVKNNVKLSNCTY
jgi:hypothetical protein